MQIMTWQQVWAFGSSLPMDYGWVPAFANHTGMLLRTQMYHRTFDKGFRISLKPDGGPRSRVWFSGVPKKIV